MDREKWTPEKNGICLHRENYELSNMRDENCGVCVWRDHTGVICSLWNEPCSIEKTCDSFILENIIRLY